MSSPESEYYCCTFHIARIDMSRIAQKNHENLSTYYMPASKDRFLWEKREHWYLFLERPMILGSKGHQASYE